MAHHLISLHEWCYLLVWLVLLYLFCMATTEGPPGADDDDDSVTDNFGGEHELFGNCIDSI